MGAAENASSSPPMNPGKVAWTAGVCGLVGVGLLLVAGLLSGGRSAATKSLGNAAATISGVVIYVATPLLALLASRIVRRNWQAIVALEGPSRDERALRLLAFRLLAVALFLALAPALPGVVTLSMGLCLQQAFRGGLSLLVSVAALGAIYAAWVVAKLYGWIPGQNRWRIVALSVIPFSLLTLFGLLPIGRYTCLLWNRAAYASKTLTFDGDSNSLAQTVIVPTLESSCPPGKNVVWCSSFQLAWNVLRDDVVGAPLQVDDAEAVADRLNAAEQSIDDLEGDCVYAAAGRVEQGIIETIRREMATRFPAHRLPDFSDYGQDGGILAYSYLTVQVPFEYPFRPVRDGLTFRDSEGRQTEVEAFGLWEAYQKRYKNMREQIEVLFCRSRDHEPQWRADEYALDLCRHSWPYQVVVAVVEPNESLGAMYDEVQKAATESRQFIDYEGSSRFGANDVLKVPEMLWEIDHRFEELIGKMVTNPGVGMPIAEALQTIRFRLDRSGAALETDILAHVLALPRDFEFDRPFLVYIKKRRADQPCFVMWVDNAELLVRR